MKVTATIPHEPMSERTVAHVDVPMRGREYGYLRAADIKHTGEVGHRVPQKRVENRIEKIGDVLQRSVLWASQCHRTRTHTGKEVDGKGDIRRSKARMMQLTETTKSMKHSFHRYLNELNWTNSAPTFCPNFSPRNVHLRHVLRPARLELGTYQLRVAVSARLLLV